MENSFHFFFSFLLLLSSSCALNTDGIVLLSFKYSILSDPLSVLETWNYDDLTPCTWTGVTCAKLGTPDSMDLFRVTGLILPNAHLLGSISSDLGSLPFLQQLDLSNNFFNGSIPLSLFNSSTLQELSLANNVLSGNIPTPDEGSLSPLQYLNLSDNALAGEIPKFLTSLSNLTVLSLRSNYFSGQFPLGFKNVEVLDLSSNLFNGSIPLDLDIGSLKYLNLSYNKLSGPISLGFGKHIPGNATIDVSFNNLTGEIPPTLAMQNQNTDSFSGNLNLCGKPLKKICIIPSTIAIPPNITTSSSSPAIAAIPKTIDTNPSPNTPSIPQRKQQTGLKPATITAIVVGDLTGIGLLALVAVFVYQLKKKKQAYSDNTLIKKNNAPDAHQIIVLQNSPESPENRGYSIFSSCFTIKNEDTSEGSGSDTDRGSPMGIGGLKYKKDGSLVCVDGETKIDLETLLKSSAYVLGSSSSSIVYKVVLENGSAFAVRRIGEVCMEKMKDFENQVRLIAKLRHQNLVPLRGFYWGDDEKLVIYDYVPNGNLASALNRKMGGSHLHLSLEARIKIARGIAQGLSSIHEKKYVHGNIKPSNILLDTNLVPMISDFGLERLISGYKTNGSARFLDSVTSTVSRDGSLDVPMSGRSPNNRSVATGAPYHAPESLKNLKPNSKWDIYSFGIVLLELLSGKVFLDWELSQWGSITTVIEEHIFKMVDMTIRGDANAMRDATLACFKVGFSCAALVPQKRPSMKEALQILEKISIPSSS